MAAATFHIGERIPLQLDFTANPDAHLVATTASYDRSGRMGIESYEVSPSSGFLDPLKEYFATGSFMGGGLRGIQELSDKPYTMHLNMNEWVRFDSPGDYTVVVHSTRVFRPDKMMFAGEPQPVTSNAIRLHIVAATPEWQKATLAHAMQVLATKPTQSGPTTQDVQGAIADVRFLDSGDSIPVMAAGLGDDQPDRNFVYALGLIGLPPALTEAAERAVRERIDDPDVAVSDRHLMALVGLETNDAGDGENGFKARRAAYDAAAHAAVYAMANKRGKAKVDTADVLLREYSSGMTAEDKTAIAQALGAGFTQLPEDKQAMLLGWQWDALRPAISAQTLEQIASLPMNVPTYGRAELKSAALSRLYEQDPEVAKRVAYEAIDSATPSLTASKLWFLPATPLPEFESVWAQALLSPTGENNPEVLAGLMTRFGTGEFASQVAAKVRASLEDGQACAPEGAMLAYVVKFNADEARPLLHDALESRGKTRCYGNLFQGVAQYATGPALTDVAIETIGDQDAQTAGDAVRYLMMYGDQRAQKPIMDRYVSWTEEWAGKGDELDAVTFKPSPNNDQEQLGEWLGRALLVNQGWIADERLRAEVVKRCVGERMCSALKQVSIGESPYPVMLFQQQGRENIRVGPCEIPNLDLVRAKLAQYPRGTAFALVQPDSSADMVAFEKQVQAVFDDAGMKLAKKQ